jgi:hypothetical protein
VPRPSSPPGAKASTECPSYTRYPGHDPLRARLTMHRNHPQIATLALAKVAMRTVLEILCFPHTTRSLSNPALSIVHTINQLAVE